jgi:hypothetical protein
MKKIINFLIKSSADPKATSASIKFALVGIVPMIMQALNLVCDFGRQCYDIDASLLMLAIDAIANGVFYALSLVAVIGTVYGVARKLYRTVTGNNLALRDY